MLKYQHNIKLPSGLYIAFSKVEAKVLIASTKLYNLDNLMEHLLSLNMCENKEEIEKGFVIFNINRPERRSLLSFLNKFRPYVGDKFLMLDYLRIFNDISRYKEDVVKFASSGKFVFGKLHENRNVKLYVLPRERGFSIPLRPFTIDKNQLKKPKRVK